MTDRQPIKDIVKILMFYVVYAVLMYLAHELDLLGSLSVTPASVNGVQMTGDQFRDAFFIWSLAVSGVSFLCIMTWYYLGEWGLAAHRTHSSVWKLWWLFLLFLTLVGGVIAGVAGPTASENGFVLFLLYLGGGSLCYWLASVFCSPTNTKFLIWPAHRFRR